MDIRKDILGREPKVGDVIAFNPPAYKGLVFGEVLSFSKVCAYTGKLQFNNTVPAMIVLTISTALKLLLVLIFHHPLLYGTIFCQLTFKTNN